MLLPVRVRYTNRPLPPQCAPCLVPPPPGKTCVPVFGLCFLLDWEILEAESLPGTPALLVVSTDYGEL